MDRTLTRYLQQAGPLLFIERPLEFYAPPYLVYLPFLRLAILTICVLLFNVDQHHLYRFQWPALTPRIDQQGHRCACTERPKQKAVRIGPGVLTPGRQWLVGNYAMPAHLYLCFQIAE